MEVGIVFIVIWKIKINENVDKSEKSESNFVLVMFIALETINL